jgi:hypothetical protein
VEYYIAGTMFLACFKLTLHLEGRTRSSDDDACAEIEFNGAFGTVLTVLNFAVVFLGLSGVLALAAVMEPLLLPSRRDLVTLRHRMFVYMQTFIVVQQVLVFGILVPSFTDVCTAQQAEGLTIAAEMLLFQIFSHKAFIPLFSWGPWVIATEAQVPPADFKFLVPVAEMASKFEKGDKHGTDGVAMTDQVSGLHGKGGVAV